jgi:hypothetical protein
MEECNIVPRVKFSSFFDESIAVLCRSCLRCGMQPCVAVQQRFPPKHYKCAATIV